MEMRQKITESILLDYFNGELSKAEETEILEWKDACDENCRLFDNVQKEHHHLRWGVRSSLIKGDFSSISSRINRRNRNFRIFKLRHLVVAASIVAVVSVVSTLLLSPYFLSRIGKSMSDFGAPAHTAILELSDGTHHYIGNDETQLKEQDGTQLAVNSGKLVYDKTGQTIEQQQEELIYNKVTIPKGAGQYRIELADGSVIWLNSDSRLEYPVDFAKEERRVRISGEAYFEVARDTERPFIVETALQSILVLGTKFNVSAYPSEEALTTLASGSVKVISANNVDTVVLTPGQQSVLSSENGILTVRKVCVEDVISWKNGITSIENMSLSQVVKAISRTYDVDFDLERLQADNIILRGSIPNDERLEVVLSVLSKVADVEFKMNNDGKIRVETLK